MRYIEAGKALNGEDVSAHRLNEEIGSYILCRSCQVFFVLDKERKVVFLSVAKKVAGAFGFDEEKLKGTHFPDIFSGEERKFVKEVFIVSRRLQSFRKMTGLGRRVTFFMDHPDKEATIPLDVAFAPFMGDDGIFKGYVGGINFDEQQLVKPEEKQTIQPETPDPDNVPEHYPCAMFLVDSSLAIRGVNRLFSHITGYEKEEVTGQNMGMLWEDRSVSYPMLQRFCQGGGEMARDGEIWVRHKHGHLIKVRFSGHRYTSKNAPNEQLLAFYFLDITSLEKSLRQKDVLYLISQALNKKGSLQELLKEVHQHLSAIIKVENLMVAFYEEDTNSFTLPYMVDAFDHFASFSAANTMSGVVIRKKKSFYLHKSEIKKFVEDGSIVVQGAVPMVWIGVPMIVDGEAIGVIVAQDYDDEQGLTRDDLNMLEFLSEQIAMVVYRKNTDEKLSEDVELKNRIFSIIAHDLRAPFHSLISLTSLLEEDDELTPEEQKEVFTSLHETSRNGYNLLENLLLWARGREGRHDQYRETLNLKNLTDEVLFFQKHGAQFKDIVLENNISDDLIITSDINKLKTILRNLVSNAVKYSYKGGKVTVSARTRPGKLEVYVSDEGVGMKSEQMEMLFNPARDFTTPGTDNEKGAGLGLHLSKDFVRQMGGEIDVKSKKDQGSTFWFTIPLERQLSDAINISTTMLPQDENDHLKGKAILVAEDMDINYVLLSKILEKQGARVLRAENGQEAVDACEKEYIHAIFMDINMPVMNGIQATRIIHNKYPHIPIIIQTAYASELNMNESKKAGARHYMEKPLNKKSVDKVIRSIFDTS